MATTKKRKRHFFQIILQDTLQSGTFVLPKGFIRMYGEKLSDVVSLKLPTGDVWEMELRRCNDDTVRFEKKGWLDFTRFYSLEFGSLLMFRYVQVEPSKFQVLIFDKSTMEINYPKMKSIENIQLSDDDDDDDDGSMSIMSESSDQSSLPSTPPSKRMKFSTGKASCSTLGKAKYIDMGVEHHSMQSYQYHDSGVHIQLIPSGKVEAIPLSKSFKSVHPYFARILQPSYGHRPHILKVPAKFLRKYIPKENAGELKLCTSNGKCRKTWHVGHFRGVRGAKLHQGWKAFVQENKLAIGDICIFELMRNSNSYSNSKKVLFNVTILRARDRAVKFYDKQKLGGYNAGTSRPDSGFVSKYPFFQVPIRESFLFHNTLSIPRSFMKSNNLIMESKEQILTFKTEGGGSWPVKLHAYPPYPSTNNKMCGGLAAFFRGNSVEVGDICIFELIDREQKVFIVSICRAGQVVIHEVDDRGNEMN